MSWGSRSTTARRWSPVAQVVAGAPAVTVVTNSFTAAGGDGYNMLAAYEARLQLPLSYEQALRNYLARLGTIAASDARYAPGGDGRIAFVDDASPADEQPATPRTGSGGAAPVSVSGTPKPARADRCR